MAQTLAIAGADSSLGSLATAIDENTSRPRKTAQLEYLREGRLPVEGPGVDGRVGDDAVGDTSPEEVGIAGR
jgi:hypothetical protein